MNRRSKLILATSVIAPTLAWSQPTSFDNLTCQSNIEQELTSRQMPNDPVAKLEARYKALKLQDEGADEVGSQLNVIFWKICDDQYVLLQKKDRVQAVLKIPEQYRANGPVINCVPLNKAKKGYYIGVPGKLDGKINRPEAAWLLDEKQMKFVPAEPASLQCERDP